MVHAACLVCFISTINGRSNKKRKEEAYNWKAGTSSGHITNLRRSILETFNIYVVSNGSAIDRALGLYSQTLSRTY